MAIGPHDFLENATIRKVNYLKHHKLYPYFRAIESNTASTVVVNHEESVMIGSNNYLGLTHHPYVVEKAIKAIEKFGTGCTGSRFLNGNFSIHEELEERLARFMGHESALVYSTGMQVNLGSISALIGPRDCAFTDQENHASILDAHRLSLGDTFKYKHHNMKELEELLQANQSRYKKMLIVTDGVFSMTGDVANLPAICKLAKQYGAYVYVDDAHGLGVLGRNGRGTADSFDLTSQTDFVMGTFSKSFASIGGFISGSRESIDYLRHLSRTFIFSAALPPSAVGTIIGCLDLMEKDNSLFENLWDNTHFMMKGLKDIGYNTLNSSTPIIPLLIGDELKVMKITKFLEDHHVFATPVIPPAAPIGMSLIRTSYSAAHKRSELQYCLDVLEKAYQLFRPYEVETHAP